MEPVLAHTAPPHSRTPRHMPNPGLDDIDTSRECAPVVKPKRDKSPCSVIPMEDFGWVNRLPDTAAASSKSNVEKERNEGESGKLMYPRGKALLHPAGPLLLQYAQDGCPVDVGRPWSKEEILTAAKRGPHKSALEPDAITMMHAEVQDKVKEGFAEVVYLDEIEGALGSGKWEHLKISPLAMVPHKSRKYRAILDLSFSLKVFGMTIPSVNEETIITAPQHSMRQLGSVLPRLINAVATAPVNKGNMVFSKLDIKDGYWRMVVEEGRHLNFAYVLPDVAGARIRLVIPSALQMGWAESPPFFCAATETARDLAEVMVTEELGSLAPHPLEHLMLPPAKWPEATLASTCDKYLRVMEVYVDDFCTLVQTSDVNILRQVSRSLLHSIHSVFPPPAISGHSGGDPISHKKTP